MNTIPDLSKLELFDGNHYKRWSEKLLFFLESLNVDFVLYEENQIPEDLNEPARSASIKQFEKANKTCRGHILNYLSNPLFDIYCTNKSAKDIWDQLRKKYSVEDAGSKKYVVSRFLEFKMTDDKAILEQIHEYQNIVHDVKSEGMTVDDAFMAAALVEKLPPSWKDYRNSLMHKRRDMSLEDVIIHLRIEDANRKKTDLAQEFSSRANIVEVKPAANQGRHHGGHQGGQNGGRGHHHHGSGRNQTNKFPKKQQTSGGNMHFKKPEGIHKKKKGTCYVCGKRTKTVIHYFW